MNSNSFNTNSIMKNKTILIIIYKLTKTKTKTKTNINLLIIIFNSHPLNNFLNSLANSPQLIKIKIFRKLIQINKKMNVKLILRISYLSLAINFLSALRVTK